jgi:2-oxoglutarate ferredoxin oxidoreductase subunit delta
MKMVEINIDEKLCKGCYFCVELCPKKVLGKSSVLSPKGYIIAEVERPEDCIVCRLCERICPDFAISVNETGDNSEKKKI